MPNIDLLNLPIVVSGQGSNFSPMRYLNVDGDLVYAMSLFLPVAISLYGPGVQWAAYPYYDVQGSIAASSISDTDMAIKFSGTQINLPPHVDHYVFYRTGGLMNFPANTLGTAWVWSGRPETVNAASTRITAFLGHRVNSDRLRASVSLYTYGFIFVIS